MSTEQSLDLIFSRKLLSLATADVKKLAPWIKLRDAWVYAYGRDHWEFHGPGDFMWHGRASNAYEARFKGWHAWMENYTKDRPELE